MTDLEPRLINWKLVFKDKPQYQRAKSLEGNYKAPPVWEAPALKHTPDLNDAILIEKMVIQLPEKHKMVLVTQYMYPYLLINSGFAKTCTKIGISRKSEVFEEYLAQSKNIILNLLTRYSV